MERKVLGRGLDSLITPVDSQAGKERVQNIRIEQVRASKYQPRLTFSDDRIEELSRSIREKGIIQPVLVRQAADGNYELIAGERRWRAAKKAGLTEIPAIIRRVHDADLLEMSIIENIQREELNALEEAKAYQRLAQEFGFTQDAIAQKVGRDKTSISNILRLLNLPDKIQDCLSQNLISFGHARALLAIADEKRQIQFCERIIKDGLSVRQVEGFSISKRRAGRTAQGPQKDRDVLAAEERLRQRLGTKVTLHHGKKRGSIEIEYYSLEDLERVMSIIGA